MKLNFIKRKKGFTLIELVVVITIMAILGLIIVPNLTAYVNKSDDARILANMKTVHTAAELVNQTERKLDQNQISKLSNNSKVSIDIIKDENKVYGTYYVEKHGNKIIVKHVDKTSKLHFYPEEIANDSGESPVIPPVVPEPPTPEPPTPEPPTPEPPTPEPPGIYTKEQIEALKVQGYIEVKTAEELNSVRNNLSGKYIQTQDIDLSTITNFDPIGNDSTKLTGTYDGGGYKVINLTIDKPSQNYVGLFGYTEGATIENVALENIDITGNRLVGGLVGYAYTSTTITNSYATGSVTGAGRGDYVGGLVGYVGNSTIRNSYATGSVEGTGTVGGLVGYVGNSTIRNSYATGRVTGSGDNVGGLVGSTHNGSTITNSYATGEVRGNRQVGGLVGRANTRTTITNSYSTGSVTGEKEVGVLVGWADGTITNSYATGSVTGTDYVGGLVGRTASTSTITNSYATGRVTSGSYYTGGLVGDAHSSSTTTNSYWDRQATGQPGSARGTGKTTVQMKQQTTYSGWDFVNVWKIDEGNDYPKLR